MFHLNLSPNTIVSLPTRAMLTCCFQSDPDCRGCLKRKQTWSCDLELSPHLTGPEEPRGQFPVFHLVMGQQHWEPPEQLFFAVPLPCPSVVAAAAHRVAYLSLRIITAGDRKHLNTLELVAQVHFMHPYLQHALLSLEEPRPLHRWWTRPGWKGLSDLTDLLIFCSSWGWEKDVTLLIFMIKFQKLQLIWVCFSDRCCCFLLKLLEVQRSMLLSWSKDDWTCNGRKTKPGLHSGLVFEELLAVVSNIDLFSEMQVWKELFSSCTSCCSYTEENGGAFPSCQQHPAAGVRLSCPMGDTTAASSWCLSSSCNLLCSKVPK